MESLASSSTVQLQSPPSGLSINTTPKPRNSVTFKHRSKQVWCTSSSTMKTSATDPSTKKAKEAKLWGGRFEEGVTDAVERFTESISFDKALYKQDIMGSRAHASMLAHQVPFSFLSYQFYSSLCLFLRNRMRVEPKKRRRRNCFFIWFFVFIFCFLETKHCISFSWKPNRELGV